MSASSPYFKNVVNVGDLFFEYSFMYMDGPIVFTCVDRQGDLYLCVCRDAYEQVEWLVSKIDVYTLRKLVGNQISINEALLSDKKEIVQIIWDPKTKTEHSKPFLADNLPDDLLPEEDVFLDDDGESDEYVKQVIERMGCSYSSVSDNQPVIDLKKTLTDLRFRVGLNCLLVSQSIRDVQNYGPDDKSVRYSYNPVYSCTKV